MLYAHAITIATIFTLVFVAIIMAFITCLYRIRQSRTTKGQAPTDASLLYAPLKRPPDGFRGFKFGLPLTDFLAQDGVRVTTLKTPSKYGNKLYQLETDDLNINDIDVTSIYYRFFKDKFYSVVIFYDINDDRTRNLITHELSIEYGTPVIDLSDPESNSYIWQWEQALIMQSDGSVMIGDLQAIRQICNMSDYPDAINAVLN